MSVKFFGQFLVEQGELDANAIREALSWMDQQNRPLGQLAVEAGYLSERQVLQVNAEQRNRDLDFGEMAVELKLLDPQELADVVARQRSRRIPIGQALVSRGFLEGNRLGELLDAYQKDQADFAPDQMTWPEEFVEKPAARLAVELLPRFLMRVARMQSKVGEIRSCVVAPESAEFSVSISLRGADGVELILTGDRDFSATVAMASGGILEAELDDELIADGVGEFLNVLAGNVVAAMAKAGHRVELGVPNYEGGVEADWEVDLAAGIGQARALLKIL